MGRIPEGAWTNSPQCWTARFPCLSLEAAIALRIYAPEEVLLFHQAIEEVVIPATRRLYERRRKRLGLETIRPWDLNVDVYGLPPLKPFTNVEQLEEKVSSAIFMKVDPQLGKYFEMMRREIY